MGSREDQIARIRQIERIKALEASRSQAPSEDDGLSFSERMGKKVVDAMGGKEAVTPDAKTLPALTQGAAQALTFGHVPEMQAKVSQALNPVFNLMTGNDVPPEDYQTAVHGFRKRDKDLKKTNPWGYGTGTAAGMVAPMAVMPGGAAVEALEGSPWLQAGAKSLIQGGSAAAMGFAQNPEEDDPELAFNKRVEQAKGLPTILSAALPFAGVAAEKSSKYLAPKLSYISQGPFVRQAKRALGFGEDSAQSMDQLGQAGLDHGIIGWLPRSFKKMGERASKALKGANDELAAYKNQLAAEAKTLLSENPGISKEDLAKHLEDKFIIKDPNTYLGNPAIEREQAGYQKLLEGLRAHPQEDWDMMTSFGQKTNASKVARYDKTNVNNDITVPEEKWFGEKDRKLKEMLDAKGKEVNTAKGMPDAKVYSDYSEPVASLNTIEDTLKGREAHNVVKDNLFQVGLPAVGGFLQGEGSVEDRLKKAALYGGVGLLGSKLVPYGAQVGAKTLDAASRLRMPTNPWVLPRIATELNKEEQ